MHFKDIIGQEEVKSRLIKSVNDNRIPHAQLFTGPEGSGKLALALAFAQFLSCQERTKNDSCGSCPSCHKYNKLIHPDLHFVFPINAPDKTASGEDEKNSTPKTCDGHLPLWREALLANPYISEYDWYEHIGLENKQGIISTAESSEIIKKLSFKSFEADYKTMIIWLPERMNHFASNKLLKLIEEPPQKTLFLLVSENPNQLLQTILSRTQQIMIPPINHQSIAIALVDRYQVAPAKANDIGRISNGSFRNAQNLMAYELDNQYFIMYRNLMRHCYSNNVPGLLDWAEEAASMGREHLKELLTYSLKLSRESLMLNMELDDITYLAGEEADFGKKFSPYINDGNIFPIYSEFTSAYEHITRNGNPSIVLTDMCLKLVKLIN